MRQRHLRPVAAAAPAELAEFDPNEWATPADQGAWGPAFCRWIDARRAWMKTHGTETSLGNWLEVLRCEHRTRDECYANQAKLQ